MTRTRAAGRPGRRARRLGLVACAVVAVLGSSLVVWQSAYAGFSASSAPVTARVATGSVVLGDDDAEQSLFAVSGIKPGAGGERCIRVTSSGTAPATVRMYGTGRSTSNGLATSLRLTLELGTGGSAASCTGFTRSATVHDGTLAGFTAAGFSANVGGWTTTGAAPEHRTYRISWRLPADAPQSVQGGSAGVTFVWEARNR